MPACTASAAGAVMSASSGWAYAWRGHGIGTALLTALIELADNWLDLRRLELCVFEDNAAAIALYARFGFRQEGVMRAYAYRDGRYVNSLAMARLRGLTTEAAPADHS
jgi:L-phenylalanine/L-methionine N-acetyltransferase